MTMKKQKNILIALRAIQKQDSIYYIIIIMSEIKQAYQEILDVCKKYSSCEFVIENGHFKDIKEMQEKCKNHLMIIEWNEKYSLNISHDKRLYCSNYIELWNNRHLVFYEDARAEKEKWCGRYISWEDNDRQPENEWLLNLSFCNGAYIFWDNYQQDTFREFFEELKTYNPKYIDTVNHSLYFSIEDVHNVLDTYDDVYKKYKDIYDTNTQENRIKQLEEELQKLKQ